MFDFVPDRFLSPLRRRARLLVALWFLCALASLGMCVHETQAAARTKAELLVAAEVARPGDTVLAGVHLKMDRGWHTYWRNPGESGIATKIEWKLPATVSAGAVQWPAPQAFETEGITTYVYHNEVVLLVPLKVASTAVPGSLELAAKVSWLECELACVPGGAEVKATLSIGAESKPSQAADLLEAWRKKIPGPNPALRSLATWEPPKPDGTMNLVISGVAADGFQPTDFYAYENAAFEVSPGATVAPAEEGKFRLRKVVKVEAKEKASSLVGLLVQGLPAGPPLAAYEVTLPPPTISIAGSPPAASTGSPVAARSAGAGGALWGMLGLAFLGGLILNIMPCVLPVIALKVFGFVQQSKQSPTSVRRLGLIYGVGVLVSFLVLAAMVIAVQQAGGSASWGMQMQNLYFRLALTGIVTLVSLNLFGLFEVTLGGSTMGAAASLASQHGGVGAFFNGVLATALATPCTAPFLTVALGFAFTQSPAVIVLMFAATALGLATPYVILSWQPGWLKFLPKPGAWMQRFKVLMGFPMLATAVWLFDITASSFGEAGPLWLGLGLVILGLAAWIWGEFVQRGVRRQGLAAVMCVALLGFDYGYVLEGQLHWRSPAGRSTREGVIQDHPGGIEWHPWSAAAVEQSRAQGRLVLVDFTAKWCLTCKANKQFALDVPPVRAKLKELNAVAFRADDTDPNPAITAELRRYDRAGVPLVLIFPAKPQESAIVLPALLSPGEVLASLAKAAEVH